MSKKIIVLYMLIFGGIVTVQNTNSYFTSNLNYSLNKMGATLVDIELDPDEVFAPDNTIEPGDQITKEFTVKNLGLSGMPYVLNLVNISESSGLCNVLNARLTNLSTASSTTFLPLAALVVEESALVVDTSYELQIELPSDQEDNESLNGQTCTFDLEVNIWTVDLEKGKAFHDSEKFSNEVETPVGENTINGINSIQSESSNQMDTQTTESVDPDQPIQPVPSISNELIEEPLETSESINE